MKRRRIFTREFKLSVLWELENGKSAAELCREHALSPSLLYKWRCQYRENPQSAFSGHGNINSLNARIAELERIVGRLYAENNFLKKTLATLEARLQDYRRKEEWR